MPLPRRTPHVRRRAGAVSSSRRRNEPRTVTDGRFTSGLTFKSFIHISLRNWTGSGRTSGPRTCPEEMLRPGWVRLTNAEEDMRCSRCKVEGDRPTPSEGRPSQMQPSHDWHRLVRLICDRCGAVLPPEDPARDRLSISDQLERFGLAADTEPLLDP